MGTWGVGPFDNDAAGDMAAAMMRRIDPALDHMNRAEARYHYLEARAAAQFIVMTHGTDILGGPSIDKVIKLLYRMRTDTDWLAEFREPKKIAEALDAELNAVLARMHTCKGCKNKSKDDWTVLAKLVREARRAAVPKPRKFGHRLRRIAKPKRARRTARLIRKRR